RERAREHCDERNRPHRANLIIAHLTPRTWGLPHVERRYFLRAFARARSPSIIRRSRKSFAANGALRRGLSSVWLTPSNGGGKASRSATRHRQTGQTSRRPNPDTAAAVLPIRTWPQRRWVGKPLVEA